jgi:hypothetical protein
LFDGALSDQYKSIHSAYLDGTALPVFALLQPDTNVVHGALTKAILAAMRNVHQCPAVTHYTQVQMLVINRNPLVLGGVAFCIHLNIFSSVPTYSLLCTNQYLCTLDRFG